MDTKGISEALRAGLRQTKSNKSAGLLKLSEAFKKLSEAETKEDREDKENDEAGS
jgi:hypothetical protein